MPMDTTDYDRIGNIVDTAFQRLEKQVALMMPRDESLTRHIANADRIAQAEKRLAEIMTGMADMAKWSMSEHDKIREVSSTKIERLENSVNARFTSVEAGINEINKNISDARATTLRYIVSVVVSFVLGGGALGIIEYIRSLH